MVVISVIGTSGVGKSFLVKQLASLTCSPGFFEGEEGVIPKDILESIIVSKNPIPRWEWFIKRYKENLEKAHKISDKLDIDCYVDGDSITPYGIIGFEKKIYHDRLYKLIDSIKNLRSDKTILLIADAEKIKEMIDNRNRNAENIDKTFVINRALEIQKSLIKICKSNKNIIVIDRSNLDFNKEEDLKSILDKITAP